MQKDFIVQRQKKKSPWGWKEPRTCLFLNLWNKVIPRAYYLILFRDYQEVVASLLRRRKKNLINSNIPFYKIPKRWIQYHFFKRRYIKLYLNIWLRYNKDILSHLKNQDDLSKVIVIDQKNLLPQESLIINILSNSFGLNLNHFPLTKIFNRNMLSKSENISAPNHLKGLCESCLQELRLYEQKSNLLHA